LFLGPVEAEHHGERVWQSKVAHPVAAKKQRDWRGKKHDILLQEYMPTDLIPSTRPYLQRFPVSPNNHQIVNTRWINALMKPEP
jgi:hypothetical protein